MDDAKLSFYTLYYIVICVLALIAYKDLKTFRIPNESIVVLIVLWFASFYFNTQPHQYEILTVFLPFLREGALFAFLDRMAAALCIAGGLLLAAVLYEQISGKYSFGGGDIKLLFAVSLFLGFWTGLMNVVLACCLGLIFAPIWRRFSRGQRRSVQKTPVFPFGPTIAASSGFFILKIILLA